MVKLIDCLLSWLLGGLTIDKTYVSNMDIEVQPYFLIKFSFKNVYLYT